MPGLTRGSYASQCGMAWTELKPPSAYSCPPAAATACPPRLDAMEPGSSSQLQAGGAGDEQKQQK